MPTVAQHYIRRRAKAALVGSGDSAELRAPVVLMVSGGADSTALLVMACTSELDIDDGRGCTRIARERLHVLHVNHHLRGASSEADEEFVRSLCSAYGLPLCVEHASFEELGGQNLEAAAREVRYAAARRYVRELCEQLGAPRSAARILTAHTASDRAETFFMNAIRGSGLAGLSSIPRRRNVIVRPLIEYTHSDLVGYLEVRGQSWREDESNADTSYLRNFVRHRIVPVAKERNGNVERTVGSACDILGDEDAFLSQLSATALRSCIRRKAKGLVVLDGSRLVSAEIVIARRMVRAALMDLDPDIRLEMRHIESVLECAARGEGSLTLPGGIDARMEFGTLSLRTPEGRESVAAGWLSVPGDMAVANGCMLRAGLFRVPRDADVVELARKVSLGGDDVPAGSAVLVDAEALGYLEADLARIVAAVQSDAPGGSSGRLPRLWVDAPQPGDVMCPLGMQGRSKKLSDILGACRVPVAERGAIPVLRTSPKGAVVWAAGVRLDERFKCGPATRYVVRLELDSVI